MEPVSSTVGTIFKLVQAIAKAASTARRNKTRCQELAQRAQEVGGVLGKYKAAAAATSTWSMLGRLEGALDDALKLVESCRRSGSLLSKFCMLVESGGLAAKLDDVNSRITACQVDLSAAMTASTNKKIDQLGTARDHRRANNSRQINAGNGGRMEKKKMDDQFAPRVHRRANNSREINAVKNGNKGGWKKGGQQNGGKGGKRRRGKKAVAAAGPPCPDAGAGAGVPYYPPYHHSMEEDPTSCSVM